MDHSDEDWFSKDLDDFVLSGKNSKDNSDSGKDDDWSQNESAAGTANLQNPFFLQDNYGGNYDANLPSSKRKSSNNKNKSKGDVYVQAIPVKKLSIISELPALDLFLEILDTEQEFYETLHKENITDQPIMLTLKIIAVVCDFPLHEHSQCFLNNVVKITNYWHHIQLFTEKTNKIAVKNKKSLLTDSVNQFWENIVILCRFIIRNIVYDQLFIDFIQNIVNNLCKTDNAAQETIKAQFEQMQIEINGKAEEKLAVEIYPTIEEIKKTEPTILEPNIVKGQYPSVEHYLNIHLSLLKEDFLSPLRDGINKYISDVSEGKKKIHNYNIRIYDPVKILLKDNTTNKTGKGEFLIVDLWPNSRMGATFSGKPIPKESKRFLYGSLLCFTTDISFNNLILASVTDRDLLENGFIKMEIIYLQNVDFNIFEHNFIMVESEIFFEPYHQVFRVMKSLNAMNFPMKDYIIDIKISNEYPDYLQQATTAQYKIGRFSVNIKNDNAWPDPKDITLNKSQFDAFRRALTKKFCIIQGPPGTGKTFIGQKIVTSLITNTKLQILIICYTNHALDQFLSGILKYSRDIVRIGNQSKHEELDNFNIKRLSETIKVPEHKKLNCVYYKTKMRYTNLMTKFEEFLIKIEGSDGEDKEKYLQELFQIQNQLKIESRKIDELKQISDYNLIKNKRIIGMTTTGAARCNVLLHLLQTPIVLIEEAAEILESHIMATITKHTQHLILIGDHQQLRPTNSVYKLAREYKMNISMFERMVMNGINCTTLNTQHRMRPEIANLIRPTIYPVLLDNENVLKYENIRGVDKNIYFINHSFPESQNDDETTKKNTHEAQFLIYFANYLMLQGYKANDITILTTYNGQLMQLFNERKKIDFLKNVRITVVDNYQGEECKIILLSLVRSNNQNTIGYLGMKNRICVALSRAKEGFYLIGNMDLLSSNSNIWNDIKLTLMEENSIGDKLPLKCSQHGNITYVDNAENFQVFKYGGCDHNCGQQLNCGHNCELLCHSNFFNHTSSCTCK